MARKLSFSRSRPGRPRRRVPKKVGAPPGTLVHIGERRAERVRLTAMTYDGERLTERVLREVDECSSLLGTTEVTWINVDGIHQIETMERLQSSFALHPLVMEDILDTRQRPKVEDYQEYLFIVLKMFLFDAEKGGIDTEQVSLILGEGYVLSLQEKEGDVFDGVRQRLRQRKGRIRQMGAAYLTYALIDSVVDSYFEILERIDDRIEHLEDELIEAPSPESLRKLHQLKAEMIELRKSVWPLREIISRLQHFESPLIQEDLRFFFRDVYDHTIQVLDTVETFRDILAGMFDLYLSSISNRMNEIMKVLTIIATIFIPLTFIAGIYGMNFEYMPELERRWGYPAVLGLMALIAGGMLVYFRRKKWL